MIASVLFYDGTVQKRDDTDRLGFVEREGCKRDQQRIPERPMADRTLSKVGTTTITATLNSVLIAGSPLLAPPGDDSSQPGERPAPLHAC
jgi:hypothetical protein